MEFYEVLNNYCNRNSGNVSKEDKKRFSYMLRRVFSAQFPIQCEYINRIDTDPLASSILLGLLAGRYTGIPSFMKEKITQKKKNETIRSFYDDAVIDKYMSINECGIREVEQAYAVNKTELDKTMNLIKKTFFSNKDSVIVKKRKVKDEKSLF